MVHVDRVGHVVVKVRSLERSVPFYRDVLGLEDVARFQSKNMGGTMAFFRCGPANHHDIALFEVGEEAADPPKKSIGMAHMALRVGKSLDELREARDWLQRHNVPFGRTVDHTVSQSIYLADPDGNEIELYVDDPSEIWVEHPELVASGKPLEI